MWVQTNDSGAQITIRKKSFFFFAHHQYRIFWLSTWNKLAFVMPQSFTSCLLRTNTPPLGADFTSTNSEFRCEIHSYFPQLFKVLGTRPSTKASQNAIANLKRVIQQRYRKMIFNRGAPSISNSALYAIALRFYGDAPVPATYIYVESCCRARRIWDWRRALLHENFIKWPRNKRISISKHCSPLHLWPGNSPSQVVLH